MRVGNRIALGTQDILTCVSLCLLYYCVVVVVLILVLRLFIPVV